MARHGQGTAVIWSSLSNCFTAINCLGRLIRLIRIIRLIRSSSQPYLDEIVWMVIKGRRESKSTFGADKYMFASYLLGSSKERVFIERYRSKMFALKYSIFIKKEYKNETCSM